MPYVVVPVKGGFQVTNLITGKRYSKKPLTKEMAEKQMRALYIHAKD